MGYSENRNMDSSDHFVGSNFMQLKAVNECYDWKCNTKVQDSRRVSNLVDNL